MLANNKIPLAGMAARGNLEGFFPLASVEDYRNRGTVVYGYLTNLWVRLPLSVFTTTMYDPLGQLRVERAVLPAGASIREKARRAPPIS